MQTRIDKQSFKCIDAHTCGNPVRVVVENRPELEGETMDDKRHYFKRNLDWIRQGLMFEPRGHDAMSGSIIYAPDNPEYDLSILFIEVSGCLPMCGHGTIGTVTVAIEEKLVTPKTPGRLVLDTPAGRVIATYEMDGDYVESVSIANVASFMHSSGLEIEIPGLGRLEVDVSYGGNFYAIIDPQKNYRDLSQLSADDIRRLSPLVREQVNAAAEFIHPDNPLIEGVSHVMWTGKATDDSATSRNAVFYGERGIDRSPCGTGTSARMAQLVQRGKLGIDESFVHQSIIGSKFIGRATDRCRVGAFEAILPTIQGWARITGKNEIIIDPRDPYAQGFLLS